MSSVLDEVGAQVAAGKAPSLEQLRALAEATDLVRLGILGDQARRVKHGHDVTYLRVADVTPADVETFSVPDTAGEVRLTGEPESADAAVQAVRTLVRRAGKVPVTAWSLVTLQRLAGGAGGDAALVDLARRLAGAGLAAVSEAPVDLLDEPARAVSALCKAGLPVARFTLHQLASIEGGVQRLQQVKALQKATGAVCAFAPLARAQDPRAPSTGYDDVKTVALARLWLDSVESIQVDWQVHGPKLAQVALVFGADDVDAVPAAAGAEGGPRRATLEEVRRNIVAASLTPVERDGRWAVRNA